MTTTDAQAGPPGRRPLTIENAVVTIRAVRVDGKPMTIAVFNQLPQRRYDHQSPGIIGWIRRCPRDCLAAEDRWDRSSQVDHRHLLATVSYTDGPMLLWTPLNGGWEYHEPWTDENREERERYTAKAARFLAWLGSLPQVYVAA